MSMRVSTLALSSLVLPLHAGALRAGGLVNRALSSTTMSMGMRDPPASDTKRLILVRHGEVDLAQFGGRQCFYGGMDIPLSTRGQAEAKAAATMLESEEKVDIIWASPLSRAHFGAKCIAARQGVPEGDIILHENFREVNRGGWNGKTAEEVGEEEISKWNGDPHYPMPGGGESLANVAKRVLAAKDEVRVYVFGGA